jgi:uncharacterized protein
MKLPDVVETKTVEMTEPGVTGLGAAELKVAELGEFRPRRFLSNGHLMTIVGNYFPRVYALPVEEPWFVEVEPASESRRSTVLRCDCDWQPVEVRRERLTLVLVHGLEGSSRSQYILGTATRAWAAGCNVVRMNMRSCGGTDELSPGIYHSGRSEDVAAVVDGLVREHGLSRIALVGFSMGGNLVLKYAGERSSAIPLKPTNGLNGAPELRSTHRLNERSELRSTAGLNGAPSELCAVVGISPLMDLAASSKALHERANRIYERRFLRNMVARFQKKAEIFPEIYSSSAAEAVRAIRSANSMRAFDQEVVARYAPFADADDYYRQVASSRWASEFAVPTLIIHALDDPFIRMLPSTREALSENEHVTFVETRHGGHCAFLAPGKGSERHWAEKSLVEWLLGVVGNAI